MGLFARRTVSTTELKKVKSPLDEL